MTTCELTELPAEMCSHCRGMDALPKGLPVSAYGIARYDSRCPNCDGHIQGGDWIGKTDDGDWVCARCGE